MGGPSARLPLVPSPAAASARRTSPLQARSPTATSSPPVDLPRVQPQKEQIRHALVPNALWFGKTASVDADGLVPVASPRR